MDIIKTSEICDQEVVRDARNDALWLTKRHLEGFRAQKQYVLNLEQDISDRYETTNKMVATYDEHIGHSSVEMLHPGAKLAENDEHQEQRVELIKAKHIVERLGRAIGELPNIQRIILQRRYIDPDPALWSDIAVEVGYEENNCFVHHNKGLRSVATSLYGIEEVIKADKAKNEKRKKRIVLR